MASTQRRGLVLAVILAGYLLVLIDVSILMVALPRIHHDLGFSPTSLSWAQNAYTLTFCAQDRLVGENPRSWWIRGSATIRIDTSIRTSRYPAMITASTSPRLCVDAISPAPQHAGGTSASLPARRR